MTTDRSPLNVITLQPGDATPRDIILRALPVAIITGVTIFLYPGDASATTIILRDPLTAEAPSGFPTQFSGLRYYSGATVKELCLVALADAPAGAQWRVQKSGTTYAVYMVDTADPNASGVRVQTPSGVKSARLKT